jgi:integration host factor subunit alpha
LRANPPQFLKILSVFSVGCGDTSLTGRISVDSLPQTKKNYAVGRLSVMSAKTLTRADLAEAVVRKVGLPRNESQELVELVLNEISGSLSRGEAVKLSSFGSFGIRSKGERIGRNPKTGKEVPITPRRVLVFRPSNIMKDRINAGLSENSKG